VSRAVLTGAIVAFAWTSISWMAIGWHGIKQVNDKEATSAALKAAAPENGIYAIPA